MSKFGILSIILGIIAAVVCGFFFIKKSEAPAPAPTEIPMEETILQEEGTAK